MLKLTLYGIAIIFLVYMIYNIVDGLMPDYEISEELKKRGWK